MTALPKKPTQAPMTRASIMRLLLPLPALAVLIGLGGWQLERRAWKNDLIARLEHGLSAPPSGYEPPRTNGESSLEFEHVRVRGEFLNAQTVKVLVPAPQSDRSRMADGYGYLLFTPLKFEKGIVFVNRGFVPQSLAGHAELFPEGVTTVTGIVRRPTTPRWFTPAPKPDERLFYDADIPAMAAAAGVKGNRAVTGEYIQAEPSAKAGEWPKARDPREFLAAIPNSHLQYALTWFGLAAAFLGVYGLYVARP
jgi:surfeit locus 1 family protein